MGLVGSVVVCLCRRAKWVLGLTGIWLQGLGRRCRVQSVEYRQCVDYRVQSLWGLGFFGQGFRFRAVNVARCLQYKVGSYRCVVDRWTQRGIT